VTFTVTVILFGIVWDPNGANLLERKLPDTVRIIWHGLYMCFPLAFGAFGSSHPVPVVMGLGYAVIAVIGIVGIKYSVGRSVLYAVVGILTVLGTVRFFLMA